jgi:hypothetical protein
MLALADPEEEGGSRGWNLLFFRKLNNYVYQCRKLD